MTQLTQVKHSWLNQDFHQTWLTQQSFNLLGFYKRSRCQEGGFFDLDRSGIPLNHRPNTLNTARLTHCYSIAAKRGHPGSLELAEWGIKSLNTVLFDQEHEGWVSSLPRDCLYDPKKSYIHAFVLLAANSAQQADIEGADELYEKALTLFERYFWSEEEQCVLESYDIDWKNLEEYRGANCNMHSTELFIQLAITNQDIKWLKRALAIVERIIHTHAKQHDYHVVEHFDQHWQPIYDFNQDQPTDDFRPYGLTPGHGFEWCHLLLNLEQAFHHFNELPPSWLVKDAIGLFKTAWAHGWKGNGIIYTYDWQQKPVVEERLHWVHAEAAVASATLLKRLDAPIYEPYYRKITGYIHNHLVDEKDGSWFQDLDCKNRISNLIWNGKPDLYHAYLMTIKLANPLTSSLL